MGKAESGLRDRLKTARRLSQGAMGMWGSRRGCLGERYEGDTELQKQCPERSGSWFSSSLLAHDLGPVIHPVTLSVPHP